MGQPFQRAVRKIRHRKIGGEPGLQGTFHDGVHASQPVQRRPDDRPARHFRQRQLVYQPEVGVGVDHRNPLDQTRIAFGERRRDMPAHRVADQHRLANAQALECTAHSRSLHRSAVLFAITWRFGSTMADQVDREDAPAGVGQGRSDLLPPRDRRRVTVQQDHRSITRRTVLAHVEVRAIQFEHPTTSERFSRPLGPGDDKGIHQQRQRHYDDEHRRHPNLHSSKRYRGVNTETN